MNVKHTKRSLNMEGTPTVEAVNELTMIPGESAFCLTHFISMADSFYAGRAIVEISGGNMAHVAVPEVVGGDNMTIGRSPKRQKMAPLSLRVQPVNVLKVIDKAGQPRARTDIERLGMKIMRLQLQQPSFPTLACFSRPETQTCSICDIEPAMSFSNPGDIPNWVLSALSEPLCHGEEPLASAGSEGLGATKTSPDTLQYPDDVAADWMEGEEDRVIHLGPLRFGLELNEGVPKLAFLELL